MRDEKLNVAIVHKYLAGVTSDKFHRYKSWDNCHRAFSTKRPSEYHSLHLAFYLASWGMYRGSSGLLQKNHLIHEGAVDILYSKKHQRLRNSVTNAISKDSIQDILELKDDLVRYYNKQQFVRGKQKAKSISSTDTLISKIMLGCYGCVPAYDRYFITGLKAKKMKHTKFNAKSLNELYDFIETNNNTIKKLQKTITLKTSKYYPAMKILDMHFWQIGYNKQMRRKS